jgi:capsule polysaccharide modification protein KpsS
LKNDLYLQAITCNPALTTLLQSRSVLLLQGPVGPFFDPEGLTGFGTLQTTNSIM